MEEEATFNINNTSEAKADMNQTEGFWKELVRMNSITFRRHAHHWIANGSSDSVIT